MAEAVPVAGVVPEQRVEPEPDQPSAALEPSAAPELEAAPEPGHEAVPESSAAPGDVAEAVPVAGVVPEQRVEPAGRAVGVPAPAGSPERTAEERAPTGPATAPGSPADPAARPGDGPAADPVVDDGRFTVRLKNFEGPFDLLLQLISRHKMDVTEVSLSRVTDEFIAHIHAMGPDWDLDQATEFLVIAATLLDLKAARLLPVADVEDEDDLALLEARDLLFARLLQYRAYKRIAEIFADRLAAEALNHPRTVGLEPHHAELLPEVVISIGPENFARLAVKAMQPKPRPQVYVDHIHAPLVSVREQARVVVALLRDLGTADFATLSAGATDTLTVVARFLALLELYREKAVALDQEEALGVLLVRWTGGTGDDPAPSVTDEFDPETAAPAPAPAVTRRKDSDHDR
ncbi:segregation/condensation protein A [Streptantibioticus silvisoli]|uniref:segregation and condensation protein A n=1 Tax=Streptantibioticus silvisoli TaxID=2705255 RepID=UPI003F6CE745